MNQNWVLLELDWTVSAFPNVQHYQVRHKPKLLLSSPWRSHVLTCVAMKIRAVLRFWAITVFGF